MLGLDGILLCFAALLRISPQVEPSDINKIWLIQVSGRQNHDKLPHRQKESMN